jgi:DNA adenine methylase
MRPFLKWAGNKYRLLDHIRGMLPKGERLLEPFVGSGAVFLNTEYPRYLLADNNPDLISLYQQLQTQGEAFIKTCQRLFTPRTNDAEYFYRRREEFNRSDDPQRKAALFVYLNRHGYNGLCRYNASGGFNVPFGRYVRPYFPAAEMQFFHAKSRRADFVLLDFEAALQNARKGDVIYCDPPYAPLSRTANFTTYSSGGFDLPQQQRLADLAEQARRRGIPVLISNHDTEFIRSAYQHASDLKEFSVRRTISCNGNKRGHAGELLALYR